MERGPYEFADIESKYRGPYESKYRGPYEFADIALNAESKYSRS